jgi:hypothetical protein
MRKSPEMSCAEFSACMAEIVATGENIFAHPHVKRCRMHRALLEDLEMIASAAKQLFPDLDPSDKLWRRIEEQIVPASEVTERVSDPLPGFRLISRVRVEKTRAPRRIPAEYDLEAGKGSIAVPRSRLKVGGSANPPHHGEVR